MRFLDFAATSCALRLGTLAVLLGGVLPACSATSDPAPPSTQPTGDSAGASGMAGSGTAGGAAGSSTTGNGGGGTAGTGTIGTGGMDTGGVGGTGTGGVGGTSTGGVGGTSTGGVGGTGGAGGSGGSGGSIDAVCNPIVSGTSTLTVNGVTRTFLVQLPANTSHMALLFLWHGWMQVPAEFANTVVYDVPARKWVPFDPNAFPMPLMIVTPHDLKLLPPVGLDWDIASGEKDFPFFEAMLECIQKQFSIDRTRIYSFGFSAGAVFTNLLTARYPHLFAATISESGAWFNDQTQWSDVSIPAITWTWPAFDPKDRGNVLLTHGGPRDYATVISLESTNTKAMPFLHAAKRTVVNCAHTFGHTLDPDLTQGMYYEYLWAHRLGGAPLAGMIPSFPTPARPVGATSCTFHPAP